MTARAAVIALALALVFSPAASYAQGVRVVRAHSLPIPPRTALTTTFNVEVNSKGQVVRVKSGKSSKDEMFNAQTYGNVLQMWIRHPDGSATVGLYRVIYSYEPKTKHIGRTIKLLSAGGTWGNAQGAANQMMGLVRQRQVRLQQEQDRRDRERRAAAAKLPPLSKIIPPTPTPRP